ncbi:MAG: pyroglutamyl-peptidase I [Tissierellia bacterium]|nr:pyroglutamyl-peptidase I [Tissierellia bacterium]
MKILVTGFDPFGGEKVNPAYEAVKLIPDKIAGSEIIKLEIPTVFTRSALVVEEAIKEHNPDVVLSIGQAGGRSSITVERVAINLAEARIPDNDGEQPIDQKIKEDGENAYFATIPVKAMVKKIREKGIPAHVSYTAGTYVCNSIMYNVLYMADKKYPNIRAGFIHVPYAPEQVVDKPEGTPSMPVETIAKAIEYAIEAIVENEEDYKGSMGTIM